MIGPVLPPISNLSLMNHQRCYSSQSYLVKLNAFSYEVRERTAPRIFLEQPVLPFGASQLKREDKSPITQYQSIDLIKPSNIGPLLIVGSKALARTSLGGNRPSLYLFDLPSNLPKGEQRRKASIISGCHSCTCRNLRLKSYLW
jgi:hypothetical protein